MNFKDEEPIKFEIFQTDMEKTMYWLENTIRYLSEPKLKRALTQIKEDFQRKIDFHKERGEWK